MLRENGSAECERPWEQQVKEGFARQAPTRSVPCDSGLRIPSLDEGEGHNRRGEPGNTAVGNRMHERGSAEREANHVHGPNPSKTRSPKLGASELPRQIVVSQDEAGQQEEQTDTNITAVDDGLEK